MTWCVTVGVANNQIKVILAIRDFPMCTIDSVRIVEIFLLGKQTSSLRIAKFICSSGLTKRNLKLLGKKITHLWTSKSFYRRLAGFAANFVTRAVQC